MMSRGGGSKHIKSDLDNGGPRSKPGIGHLNSGQNRMPAFNSSSVTGAGYNSKAPYISGNGNKITPGGQSINNVFNIPKYG